MPFEFTALVTTRKGRNGLLISIDIDKELLQSPNIRLNYDRLKQKLRKGRNKVHTWEEVVKAMDGAPRQRYEKKECSCYVRYYY